MSASLVKCFIELRMGDLHQKMPTVRATGATARHSRYRLVDGVEHGPDACRNEIGIGDNVKQSCPRKKHSAGYEQRSHNHILPGLCFDGFPKLRIGALHQKKVPPFTGPGHRPTKRAASSRRSRRPCSGSSGSRRPSDLQRGPAGRGASIKTTPDRASVSGSGSKPRQVRPFD